jgi:hypothetical protein
VVVVSALVDFVLLAVMVSWPWHHAAWTRADLDLAAQRHAHDQATADFCTALTKIRDASHDGIVAVREHDADTLSDAVSTIEDGFADARSAAGDLPHIEDVSAMARRLDSVRAAAAKPSSSSTNPATEALVKLSLTAKLTGAHAGCPTFN